MASRSASIRSVALVGAGVFAVLSGASPGLASTPPARADASAFGPGTAARDVTLVTGQRVHVVTRDGRTTASVMGRSAAPSAALTTIRAAGHLYVVPISARHLLGASLDPALFDVSTLASAPAGSVAARHGVTLAYAGSAPPSVPGVTIISAGGGRATGYVTDSSAPAFGAALAGEAAAPAANAGLLFGSVSRISASSPAGAASPQGSFPMYTLVVKAIDSAGHPIMFGGGILMSTDDGRKANLFFGIENGRAKVSVPAGRYLAVSDEFTGSADGSSYVDKLMLVTDFRVSNNLQTLTLDARPASAKVQPTTFPFAATMERQGVDVVATSADGYSGLSYGLSASADGQVWLPPTPPPAYGTLTENTTVSAVDPSVPGGTYHVDGGWSVNGIPVAQRQRAPGLAGMDRLGSTFFSDGPHRTGGVGVGIISPGSFGTFIEIPALALPLRRAEYTFGPTGSSSLTVVLANIEAEDPGFVDEDPRPITPGRNGSVQWMRNPLRLGVPDSLPRSSFPVDLACRTRTSLLAVLLPMDGAGYHTYEVLDNPDGTPVAHYTLYRNGVVLVDADDELGEVVPVSAAAATYRVVTTLDRSQTSPLLSTALATDVTFRSGATTATALPAGVCPVGDGSTALPLLRADVDPVGSLTGGVPAGRHDLRVAVDHPALAGAVAVTSVAVLVRPTGTTGAWSRLPVTRTGSGTYAATLTSTRAQVGTTMDLRVDATDAAGGILHQTTTAALRIGR